MSSGVVNPNFYPHDVYYVQNGQYPQNAQYPQNPQYPQNAQYHQNAQYPPSGQYPQDVQYSQNGHHPQNGQFYQLQSEINNVTDIMRDNIRLGLERGANLDDLELKAEDLNNYSQQFAFNSNEVHKKYWWKNFWMWVIIIVIIIVILTIVIVLSVLGAQHKI